MKNMDMNKLRLLAAPALTVVLGLVLLLSPDTASALVGKAVGWIAVFAALAEAFSGDRKSVIKAILFGIIGVVILKNPLYVAKFLGRALGLTLFGWGFAAVRKGGFSLNPGTILPGVVALIGLVLFLVPMTTSRLVIAGVGALIIGIGVAEGFDRLREKKQLEEPGDPSIIDVEKL